MNIISKLIFIFISASILIFLIFVTYLTNTLSSFEKPYYENNELWLFELSKDESNIYNLIKQSTSNTWTILVNKINITDKVLYSSWSIQTKIQSENVILSIEPWIYFFDLRWLEANYIIKSEWFELSSKWPWIFIINNINSKKNIIFSVNALLNLDLKNTKTNEQITDIDLFPHTYLIFNPLKNIFVKNSDLLKITQTFLLKYFNTPILENWVVSEDLFYRKLVQDESTEKSVKKLITDSLLLIKQEEIKNIKVIEDFSWSKFAYLPGEDFIDKYFYLFINSNKKTLYYKNIIIRDINKLLLTEEYNPKIIESIVGNVESLKTIDIIWAEEIKDIINYYYASTIKTNLDLEVKLNFSYLINQLNKNTSKSNLKSLIYLEEIFQKYDYENTLTFYKDINSFITKYFIDLNIDLTDEGKWNIKKVEKVDYILFFLENIMLSSNFSASHTEELMNIFNNYVKISNSFYTYSDEKTKRKWIYTNSEILIKFKEIITSNYFDKERDSNELLVINDSIEIDRKNIASLENDTKQIFDFYDKNNIVLKLSNKGDAIIIKLYSTLKENYAEYFKALTNYKEYIFDYDKSKKTLLDTNTVNEINEILTLSINQALNYLYGFNWLDLNSVEIKMMDYYYCKDPLEENETKKVEISYCYKIDNILIEWNYVSFLLHPFEKNKIDNISINNEIKPWSYKLDDIQNTQAKKKLTSSTDPSKYDFKNFLVQKFWYRVIENEQIIVIDEPEEERREEEIVVKIFKRNKLFWENWDFANIWSFLQINYNDIIVEKKWDEYLIEIEDAYFDLKLERGQSYNWELSWEYNFAPKHSFINPKIKLINKTTWVSLLYWNTIYIIWEYEVNNIEEEIKELFFIFNEITTLTNSIKNILDVNIIKMTYQKDTKKVLFNIQYNWRTIYIELDKSNVTKARYNNKNIITSITNYKNIDTILNIIKK